jgi:diguanylate cyclase (GGDEF)-like protein
MTVCVVLFALTAVMCFNVFFIRKNEHHKSEQLLLLLCETGERNLEYYFSSVQRSVRKVASFVTADLEGLEDQQLQRHMERVRKYFDEMASKTNGVLTYYYRIDPTVSKTVKGFWYTNLDGEGFVEHQVTDITLYDTKDTSKLVWFTVPKFKGEAIWLPPYITDNLDRRVISYNVPIFYKAQFIGVVGIEIDYSTMAEQVDSIRLGGNGYAFLSDLEGNLFYHPRIDVAELTDETRPKPPEGVLGKSTFVQYSFGGVEKQAAWLPLSNGMRLNVTVPLSETEGDWQKLIGNILIVALEVLAGSIIFTMIYTRRITKPLEQLTEAAEQADKGNYDYKLDYNKNDEVGRLTKTFMRLENHMKDNISDLKTQAFVDSLTQAKNKRAFTTMLEQIQGRMDKQENDLNFAIGMFDCDDLKHINDRYGHEKGDVYLKTACRVICRVFQHSPVFRIGGDEFSVLIQNEDYENREALLKEFEEAREKISAEAENQWEQVHLSMGVALYNPQKDSAVIDVLRRADEAMYENKRIRKKVRK